MTPPLLLSLWRERWGKVGASAFAQPRVYLQDWVQDLALSAVWHVPGMRGAAMGLFVSLLLLMMPVKFSLSGQLWLSGTLLLVSLAVRRYQSPLITLMLLGWAAISSSRYLFWRCEQAFVNSTDSDFVFAVVVLAAEIGSAALFALNLVVQRWPLRYTTVALPADEADWPKVGIFIVCQNAEAAQVERTLGSVTALHWPQPKMTVQCVDVQERPDLKHLLSDSAAHLLIYPDESVASLLNRAIAQSRDTISVIVNAGETFDAHLLSSGLGWFEHNPLLGLLSTPHHFLLPASEPTLPDILGVTSLKGECLMVRRSLFMEVGGFPTQPVSDTHHVALVMREAGLRTAYVATIASGTTDIQPQLCLINAPSAKAGLSWKMYAARLQQLLVRIQPLLTGIFTSVPLLYFFADVHPLPSDIPMLMSLALPHFIQSFWVQERLQSSRQLSLWKEVCEFFLAVHLLLLTTLTLVFTKLSQTNWRQVVSTERHLFPMGVIPTVLLAAHALAVMLAVMLAFTLASVQGATAQPHHNMLTLLYGAWAGYVLMLLAAQWAVAEEMQEIRLHQQGLMCIPAMIKLPNHRTVVCSTANFPAMPLTIKTPTALTLSATQPLYVSIFHHGDECAFASQLVFHHQTELCIGISDDFKAAYASFVTVASSRSEDWPKWLPDRDADQLMPTLQLPTFRDLLNKVIYWKKKT